MRCGSLRIVVERGRGPRAELRPTGTEATSPRDAASTAGWQDRVKWARHGGPGNCLPVRADPRSSAVPQVVENVTDTLRILDLPIAEQVIEVPKISCSPCPSRFFVPEPQS